MTTVLNIALICAVAAVSASAHSLKLRDAVFHEKTEKTATNVDYQGQIVDMLFAVNCETIVYLSDKSVQTIIANTDVVHDCIGDITRALTSHGAVVIIVGDNRADVALAILNIYDQADLYFNKYFVEPESVKYLNNFIFGKSELEIKSFVTSEAIIKQLYALISDQKYEEAVDMSKYLYAAHFDNFKKTIVPEVYAQLMQKENGYELMNFGYKLVQNNEKAIIKDCFPLEFQWIFNGDTVRLLNKERNSTISLSTEIDGHQDRWAYIDCKGYTDSNGFFKFNPVWDKTLNSVVFQIQNPLYGMKIKLDINTLDSSRDRLAWGDHRPVDRRFAWRLKPGLNTNGELAFCLVDVVYDSYLSHGSCRSAVKGVKGTCNPDIGWVMDKSMPNSPVISDKPESFKYFTNFLYGKSEQEIKAFVTSHAIIEQLYALISDQKYEEAVDICKYLYAEHFHHFKETIVPIVYAQLMQKENGYELMNFGYILVQYNEKAIIKDCFPLAFQWIFNGDTVRLLNKERTSMMRLSTEIDGHQDRRAYIDCKGPTDSDGFFKFNPVWSMDLNSVVFQIENPLYGMKIKLDINTLNSSRDRLAWGDHRAVDRRFAWRLKPSLNTNGELAFCLVDVVYDSYLSYGSCLSHVTGVKGTCTPDMGWVMDKPMPNSLV